MKLYTLIIFLVAIIVKTYVCTYYPPFWDAAVYLLMGKYLFTQGHIGLIEPFRPLAWPLFLGTGYKFGLSIIPWGKTLEYLFNIGNILLTYLIGIKVFDKSTGFLAALLLSFSPLHAFYGNNLYTDIPACFFGLLGVFLFIDKRFFLSGIFAGVALFTKFTYLILVVILMGFSLGTPVFFAGLALTSSIFLWITFGLYHHILQPLRDSQLIYGQLHFNWWHEIFSCGQQLLTAEGLIFIIVPFGLIVFFQEFKNPFKIMIVLIGALLFLWIGKLPTNVLRFLTAPIPYFYLLSAYSFLLFYRFLIKSVLKYFLLLLLIIFLSTQLWRVCHTHFPAKTPTAIQQYITNHQGSFKGNLWICDPTLVEFSDLKTQELMYYPIVNTQKFLDLYARLHQADYIFYNDYSLACRPLNDPACTAAKEKLFKKINEDFDLEISDDKTPLLNESIYKRRNF